MRCIIAYGWASHDNMDMIACPVALYVRYLIIQM